MKMFGTISMLLLVTLAFFHCQKEAEFEYYGNRTRVEGRVIEYGTNIPLANLYWIIFSQIGAVIMGYFLFSAKIQIKDWIAILLLLVYVVVTFYYPNQE